MEALINIWIALKSMLTFHIFFNMHIRFTSGIVIMNVRIQFISEASYCMHWSMVQL